MHKRVDGVCNALHFEHVFLHLTDGKPTSRVKHVVIFLCFIVFCSYVLILIPVNYLLIVGRSFFSVFSFLFLHHAAESEYQVTELTLYGQTRCHVHVIFPLSSTQVSVRAGLLTKKKKKNTVYDYV